jgi:hypothetical protein
MKNVLPSLRWAMGEEAISEGIEITLLPESPRRPYWRVIAVVYRSGYGILAGD